MSQDHSQSGFEPCGFAAVAYDHRVCRKRVNLAAGRVDDRETEKGLGATPARKRVTSELSNAQWDVRSHVIGHWPRKSQICFRAIAEQRR
jgi:hypothetical protein